MAAADLPFVYKPLSDDDGAIHSTFQYLLLYSNLIGVGNLIYHESSQVIKFRDKSIRYQDYCLTPESQLPAKRKGVYRKIPKGGWPGGHLWYYCKRELMEKLTPDTDKYGTLREHMKVFDIFSDKKFEHHPFHYHKTILLGVEAQLKFHLTEAIRLCDILSQIRDENMEDQMEQRIFTAEYMMYSLIPQLRNIAQTIRKLIIVSKDGYYSKTHASDIAMLYRKNSTERLHIITQMAKNRCVPSKKALYDVINTRENGLMFTEEEWSKRGRKRKHGCVQDCSLEEENKCFIGRFELALIRVDSVVKNMEFYSPPKMVYICDHIGKDKEQFLVFYFSPIQFPTPADLTHAGTGAVFESLKSYIEYASEKGGSPVVCRSYKPGCKKFVCKHSKNCKFSFLVKWDMFGYYIPLMNKERTVYIGCEFHNHSRVLACPYEKYGCMYCKATYHRLADALEHEKYCKEQKHTERHFPDGLDTDTFRKRLKVAYDRKHTLLPVFASR